MTPQALRAPGQPKQLVLRAHALVRASGRARLRVPPPPSSAVLPEWAESPVRPSRAHGPAGLQAGGMVRITAPQETCARPHSQNVSTRPYLRNKVFVEKGIEVKTLEMKRILGCRGGLGWGGGGAQTSDWCPNKTDTEEVAMEMEAESGGKWPLAKEANEPPGAGKGNEWMFP